MMAIDTYAPCPGGTGKKIKFCCADLVGDLEQLDRLVGGDQISAALDQVRRLDEKHPGRPCLMATRTKLELATKQFAEATASSRAFLDAHPENPLALGQAAVTDAIAGRTQEAAALFDKARAAAVAAGRAEGGQDVSPELVRIAATLVQVGAQLGHVGFAQGIVEWVFDRGLGSEDERRLLAAIVGSAGVPAALRTKVGLASTATDAAWRHDFDAAVEHARQWRLSKALTAFRSLERVAGESRELFTNIAVVCEMLARPFEAAEAWLAVARLRDTPHDDAVEATGRAIALETEADPDRSPLVSFTSLVAPLAVAAGEEGSRALELLEDKLRHDARFETAAFDRSSWVARGAAPPRSVWRVYEPAPAGGRPARLLASLLVFGRQTDREPEAVLQGFAPDVEQARPLAAESLGCSFAPAGTAAEMPATTPTSWLMGGQFRLPAPEAGVAPPAAGSPCLFDTLMERQQEALWSRFVDLWPETPLPELLGKTPRQALADAEGARRVEALVSEGEAASRRADAGAAWTKVRERLGLAAARPITAEKPLEDLPPLRWHRLDMAQISLDELRGVLVTSVEAGFDRAAERAAAAVIARGDSTPADRWEAWGVLEERAESTVRKLEIIAELRKIAQELKANDGMLDVAELRVRLQRGDQAEIMRLLDHLRRDHARDQQVLQALAEVLMEAGIDLGALAGRGAAGVSPGGAAAAGMPAAAPPAEPGKLWTPGGETAGPGGGEKKTIWTPG
jgi:hypothetical protein